MEKARVQTKKKPFFRYDPATTVLLTLGILLVSQFIAAVLVGVYPGIKNFTETEAINWIKDSVVAQFMLFLVAGVAMIIMTLQLLKWAKVMRSRIGIVKPRLRDPGYALVAYGLYFLTHMAVIVLVGLFLPLDIEQEQQIGFGSAYTFSELLLTFIALVALPPITEEILFRGFLFSSLRAQYKFWPTTIVTSLLFGVAHLQFGSGAPLLWAAAIDTFVLSCFLCYLREKTGSLWASIFLHGFKNLLAFVLLFGSRFLFL